jgi:hypothetical protein
MQLVTSVGGAASATAAAALAHVNILREALVMGAPHSSSPPEQHPATTAATAATAATPSLHDGATAAVFADGLHTDISGMDVGGPSMAHVLAAAGGGGGGGGSGGLFGGMVGGPFGDLSSDRIQASIAAASEHGFQLLLNLNLRNDSGQVFDVRSFFFSFFFLKGRSVHLCLSLKPSVVFLAKMTRFSFRLRLWPLPNPMP